MNACIQQTRSNDATRLKSSIGLHVAPHPCKKGLTPSIINSSERVEMGLNHPTLACFLCPIDYLSEFDVDIAGQVVPPIEHFPNSVIGSTCALLNSANIHMTADALPLFLWSGD